MDIASLIGEGGPFVAAAGVIGYFLNYLINRRKAKTESESGIVEATKATLHIVTANQDALAAQLRQYRNENDELRVRLRTQSEELDRLYDENRDLRERLDALEGKTHVHKRGNPNDGRTS